MIRADKSSADSAVNKNCLGKVPAVDPETRPRQLLEVALLQFFRRCLFDRGGRPPPESSGEILSWNEDEVSLPLLYRSGGIHHQLRDLVPEVKPSFFASTVFERVAPAEEVDSGVYFLMSGEQLKADENANGIGGELSDSHPPISQAVSDGPRGGHPEPGLQLIHINSHPTPWR